MSLPPPPEPGRKFRVLVIEDDEAIARLILVCLTGVGFDCRFALDGVSGLAAFQSTNPHLVVLDLMMPGMHGRDVCAKIRETSSVPIIMMTALDTDADQVTGFKLGADDYITKPFNPKVLAARVAAQMRRVYRYDAPTVPEEPGQAEYAQSEYEPEPARMQLPAQMGWVTCDACGYIGPREQFEQVTAKGRHLACPNCKKHEAITFSLD